jgi:hypothetical protein
VESIVGPYSKFNSESIMQHSLGESNQKCQSNQISSSTIEVWLSHLREARDCEPSIKSDEKKLFDLLGNFEFILGMVI